MISLFNNIIFPALNAKKPDNSSLFQQFILRYNIIKMQ